MNNQFDGLVSSQIHYNLFHLAVSSHSSVIWHAFGPDYCGRKVTKPWLKILKKIHQHQHLLRRMVVLFHLIHFKILDISIFKEVWFPLKNCGNSICEEICFTQNKVWKREITLLHLLSSILKTEKSQNKLKLKFFLYLFEIYKVWHFYFIF